MTLSARHCSCGKHHLDHVSRGVGTRQIENLRHRRRTWRGDSSLPCRHSCRHLSCERSGLNQSIPADRTHFAISRIHPTLPVQGIRIESCPETDTSLSSLAAELL